MTALWTWISAHPAEATALAVVLLSSLATALTRYPRVGEAVYWLRWLAGLLSVLAHRDGRGLVGPLTLPLVPQRAPEPSTPSAGEGIPPGAALALVLALVLAGCGGVVTQIREDSEAVLEECVPAAVIELGRCTSRTALDRMCRRARDRGVRLPHPDCVQFLEALTAAPASQPVR